MIRETFIHAMLGASAILAASGTALADTVPDIRLTEFMYKGEGSPGEFVEFTNLGTTAVDMTGWSEDDSTRTPNKSGHSLSAFGVVQSGQSVIFTEAAPDAFRAAWGLSDRVKVIGPYSNDNLGNGDEINLYDNSGSLINSLTYGSDLRTDGVSAVPTSTSVIGANNIAGWVLSNSTALMQAQARQVIAVSGTGSSAIVNNYGQMVALNSPNVGGSTGVSAARTS